MEPVPGALELIPRLIASNHLVTIITSRTGTELEVAKTWSIEQGLNLDFIGVGYQMSKAEACAGLDIFIDDDLDKLKPLADVVPNRFLFSWGYNTHIETGTMIQRISSWQELFDKVTRLSN